MGHSHAGHTHGGGTAAGRHKGRLKGALALTAGFMVVEAVGGVLTGSLALVADAAHMLTDAGGLALALIAIRFAERPATPQKTYGYVRLEILAALLNAVVLLLLTIFILYEAVDRFLNPPPILAGPMLAVAVVGLAVNFASMKLLAAGSSESLNMKGAYFEVMSDMLGSLGVIIAALVVMFTGWRLADPIIGAGIGLFIVPRTWPLMRQAIHILMEGTPPEIDVVLLERLDQGDPRRRGGPRPACLDHHVGPRFHELPRRHRRHGARTRTLLQVNEAMKAKFNLTHTTIQIEDQALRDAEAHRGL